MKKVFFAGLGILAVLSLVFTACGQATEPDPGPTEFWADARIPEGGGGVLLSWEPVINASGYEVWRQQTTPHLEGAILLKEINRTDVTRYADVKGDEIGTLNAGYKLVPDEDYRYTIIALSNSSTSQSTAINGFPNEIIQNKAEVRGVRFSKEQLPEKIDLDPVTGLTVQYTRDEKLLVTWDIDKNPLVQYDVIINDVYIQNGPVFGNVALFENGATPIKKENTVSVVKVLGKGLYYAPSKPESKSIAIPEKAADRNIDLTAVRDNKGVTITFTTIDSFPISQYELARTKVTSSLPANWTTVSLAGATKKYDERSHQVWDEGSDDWIDEPYYVVVYTLYDNLPGDAEDTSIWLYQLTLKHGNAVYYATTEIIPAGQLKKPELTIEKNDVPPTTPSATIDDIEAIIYITYDTEADANYVLYMKQNTQSNGVALPADGSIKYDWVAVTPTKKETNYSSETLTVTLPEARVEYALKVVATSTGAKKGAESDVTTIQFRQPIIAGSSSVGAFSYVLDGPHYEASLGTQILTGGKQQTVHWISLPSLEGYSGTTEGKLRAGEELKIEIIPNGTGVAQDPRQDVTLTTSWHGNQGSPTNLNDRHYYFTIPVADVADPHETYTVKLWVYAK